MTTIDNPAELALPAELEISDVTDFIDELAELARVNIDGEPFALARGTFAMYPMEDGGVMFVTSVADGPLEGIKHTRIPPGFIRAVSVIAGGGSKLAAVKALVRKPKEIERGH
jgi:hypothetical protein